MAKTGAECTGRSRSRCFGSVSRISVNTMRSSGIYLVTLSAPISRRYSCDRDRTSCGNGGANRRCDCSGHVEQKAVRLSLFGVFDSGQPPVVASNGGATLDPARDERPKEEPPSTNHFTSAPSHAQTHVRAVARCCLVLSRSCAPHPHRHRRYIRFSSRTEIGSPFLPSTRTQVRLLF